jgi:4-hydroxy-2-oxoheptanedioate aldolase
MSLPLPTNLLKAGFRNRRRQIGFWLTLTNPSVAEIVAEAGFNWVLIDMEHAPNEVAGVVDQVRATQRAAVECVVRVPALDLAVVKRLLDGGVRSFMFPNIQTVEEATLAVRSTRYPPLGVRGVSGSTRGAGYNRIKDYFTKCEDEICVILQLETRKATAAAEAIGKVTGVDALFVGPNDLAADMGFIGQTAAVEVVAEISATLEAIKRSGRAAGILNFNCEEAERLFADGFDFIAVDGDAAILGRETNRIVERFAAVTRR